MLKTLRASGLLKEISMNSVLISFNKPDVRKTLNICLQVTHGYCSVIAYFLYLQAVAL